MNSIRIPNNLAVFIIVLLLAGSCSGERLEQCVIHTELGDIELELYPERAPLTVSNFLRYVDSNLYDNSSFFRVCTPANEAGRAFQIEVIQGGWLDEREEFDPIVIETTEQTGLAHLDGTVSMARAEPNSATSSYFICINDHPELDHGGRRNPDGYGFAAFGRVTQGMEVVRTIQSQRDSLQILFEPVAVHSIERMP